MSHNNINRVVLTGNLTRDPDLRALPGGASVTNLRIACNISRKRDGEWVSQPNFFNVTVWGARGESCARHLGKGSRVAVDGRLEWREWETQDAGKRQAVEIVADSVEFLGSPDSNGNGSSAAEADSDYEPVPVGAEEDIPS
ncbi:MAG: single-stranded DNA-binding protein [Solirubrobacteraceae bacterium]